MATRFFWPVRHSSRKMLIYVVFLGAVNDFRFVLRRHLVAHREGDSIARWRALVELCILLCGTNRQHDGNDQMTYRWRTNTTIDSIKWLLLADWPRRSVRMRRIIAHLVSDRRPQHTFWQCVGHTMGRQLPGAKYRSAYIHSYIHTYIDPGPPDFMCTSYG